MDKPNPLKINQINRYEVTHTSVTSFLFGNLRCICEVRLKEGSGAFGTGAFLSLSKNHKITPVSDIMKETGVCAGSVASI